MTLSTLALDVLRAGCVLPSSFAAGGGQCLAGAHNPSVPGATPGPATSSPVAAAAPPASGDQAGSATHALSAAPSCVAGAASRDGLDAERSGWEAEARPLCARCGQRPVAGGRAVLCDGCVDQVLDLRARAGREL